MEKILSDLYFLLNHEIVSRNFNEVSNTEVDQIRIQVFRGNEENTGYDNKFLKTHLTKTGDVFPMNTNDPARPVNHHEELSDMPTNKDASHTSAGQLRIIEPAESNWHDPIIYPASYDPRVFPFPLGRLFPMPVFVIYPSEKEGCLIERLRVGLGQQRDTNRTRESIIKLSVRINSRVDGQSVINHKDLVINMRRDRECNYYQDRIAHIQKAGEAS
ncbi:hypothetical protein EAG_02560 [Camponotus floridanus]|uniref:Uncharacterized protein n=1 Tax=Camponotus floridanus TaxID=104421 RepID=E1ZZR6_CAMFO|nr:hypothetical protein EAG_02560 [Camponotus floridanus]